MNLRASIQKQVSKKGISMAKLVRDIDMSEPGFYKMLESGSMKVKTLVKIAEALDMPLINLFEGSDNVYQTVTGNQNNTGVNSSFGDDTKDLLIKRLEQQLEDKEKIIKLLESRK